MALLSQGLTREKNQESLGSDAATSKAGSEPDVFHQEMTSFAKSGTIIGLDICFSDWGHYLRECDQKVCLMSTSLLFSKD